MSRLTAIKKGQLYGGAILTPHRYPDGCFVATTSRHDVDYVRVETEEELEALYLAGYGVRMSNPTINQGPSYIKHDSIILSSGTTKSSLAPVGSHLKRLTEEAELEKDSTIKARKEQAFLRAYLCEGKASSKCVICGSDFPVDFLVAAHIKKRSDCTKNEKLDFDNVAALMCKSGCDDLFEKGYIFVRDAKVQKNSKRRTSRKLDEVISELIGKMVNNWSGSQNYYKWHEKKYNK
ncbi:MAG: HNH endonuclease [Pseudomonadota bacterium]